MNVGDLEKLLVSIEDKNMKVLISLTGEFDGAFISPCIKESGVCGLGLYFDEEEANEAELLNKPITEDSFVLVRCGFFEEHDGLNPELN